MRTSITLARKHGQKQFVLVSDLSVSITEQADDLREILCAGGVHKEYAEVQLWDSTHGCQRVVKLHSPAEKKADEERIARENALQAEAGKPKAKGKVAPKSEAKTEESAEKKADEAKTDL